MINQKNEIKANKKNSGITLIALVVTIIVLLILAGISISMLTGNNGILQKATDAKNLTGSQSVIEQAKTDILGQIAENKGNNISKDQLKTILNKYFENISSLELPDNLSDSDIKLNANQTYGGYKNIALSEIYNGSFSINNVKKTVPDITKHKWIWSENGEESYCKFGKNGYVNWDGEVELSDTYTLDGNKLTINEEIELNWDGEKFAANFDDGEGYSALITITEIIPMTFTFSIDSTEYTAEENMTWEDWVESDFNTGSYIIGDGDFAIYVEDKWVVLFDEYGVGQFQNKDWIIDSTLNYSTEKVPDNG